MSNKVKGVLPSLESVPKSTGQVQGGPIGRKDEQLLIEGVHTDLSPPDKRAGVGYVWETFDSLFRTVHAQARQLEELNRRIDLLEKTTIRVPPAQDGTKPHEYIKPVSGAFIIDGEEVWLCALTDCRKTEGDLIHMAQAGNAPHARASLTHFFEPGFNDVGKCALCDLECSASIHTLDEARP